MAYRKLLGATGSLAAVFMLMPSFAFAVEGKVTAGEKHELRHDRREIRHDRREIQGDRKDLVQDRQELRQDLKSGAGNAEIRHDVNEIHQDRHEIVDDKRELAKDVTDLKGDQLERRQDRGEFRRDVKDALKD